MLLFDATNSDSTFRRIDLKESLFLIARKERNIVETKIDKLRYTESMQKFGYAFIK